MIAVLIAAAAWAAPEVLPPTETPKQPLLHDVRLMIRGMAESLEDDGIGTVYGNGFRAGGVGLVVPIWNGLGVEVEFAYARMKPKDEGTNRLEIMPISVPIEWSFGDRNGRLDVFLGAGPSFTVFSERHGPNEEGISVTRGTRVGIDTRVGARFDLGLIKPPMPPANAGPLRAIEIEIYLGRRFQMPHNESWTGFDLAAWRGAISLGLRF